ncbi:hypothetical protein BS47DRAFT_1323666 [Hydnum rufescens UP504]|uniref:Vacuolar import and degradation protein-domain-containing protein n=1 Tax=Hydnum rufescens UP504 TaxID=1448309 RepID=A0A9P6BC05_9AGAM|nr:hypothetical protein BS47DRAFT_1323666 [Hydnum rufescens UP504]
MRPEQLVREPQTVNADGSHQTQAAKTCPVCLAPNALPPFLDASCLCSEHSRAPLQRRLDFPAARETLKAVEIPRDPTLAPSSENPRPIESGERQGINIPQPRYRLESGSGRSNSEHDLSDLHIPQSSPSSSPPTSPRSERGHSPSFSGSPPERGWVPRPPAVPTSPESFVEESPYTDITRLRVKSEGRGALYPGSVFSGSQRSGANSYDVTVTIVDVDLSSSVLCGYLRIQNLTDDYPELTTYFDAEIIGSRFGFITADEWGASEAEDLKHWGRFPAFRPLKGELRKPHLTIRDRDRGVVFMRWKERFLVPNHKTKEINGASFAGFYYVAVTDAAEEASASMTGYYFHPHSEPYQQLTLRHIPNRMTSSFEFC